MRWLRLILVLVGLIGCGGATAPPASPLASEPVPSAPPAAAELPTSAVTALTPLAPTSPATASLAPTSPATASLAPTSLAPAPPQLSAPQSSAFLDQQALALKPANQADPAQPGLPRYTMTLKVDPQAGTFSGTQLITYTNTTGSAVPDLLLRSYVNFPADVQGDGGDTFMNVTLAQVAGQAVPLKTEAQRTAFRIKLPEALAANQTITLQTSFEGTLKPWEDGTWPFLSSYPLLAVWDAGAGKWRDDVTKFPDRVYAQTALYDVEVTLPGRFQVFASGTALSSSDDGSQQSTRFVSGPVREWAASFGSFESVSTRTNGITVTAYQAVGSQLDLLRVREVATSALESFEQRYGPYPYRELDLHVLERKGDAGIEYPGYVVILVNKQINERTDVVVAHEVAHQWWYGLVGNDIYRQPWLDESFAHFSAVVASEDREGPEFGQIIYTEAVESLYKRGLPGGDPPAGLAISEYASFNAYYYAIYGKGAVFLATLRTELGDEPFFSAMRSYYAAQRYGITSRAAFQGAMEQAAGRSLEDLFDRWLEK